MLETCYLTKMASTGLDSTTKVLVTKVFILHRDKFASQHTRNPACWFPFCTTRYLKHNKVLVTFYLVRGTPTAGVRLHWVVISRRWERIQARDSELPISTDSPRKKSATMQWLNREITGPKNTQN